MPTALMSVTDKTGLQEFARALTNKGWDLLASGGTARHLREAGLEVQEVSDYTQESEFFDGRVKTAHPAIQGGILSRRTTENQAQLSQRGWREIDMIVANLYRFEESPQVENIDVGGVTLLRSAAKNYEHVIVICEPADYARVLHEPPSIEFRKALAAKAFWLCSQYDTLIAQNLGAGSALRYGENPHQRAQLLGSGAPLGAELLWGKPLSYNNLLDGDAAWRAVEHSEGTTVCVVKHVSPCGLASSDRASAALKAALDCDRTSAFGGVIACNTPVDSDFVDELEGLFFESLLAPDYHPQALEKLKERKNLRLLKMEAQPEGTGEFRSVRGGLLWQERDLGLFDESEWKVVTETETSQDQLAALSFAWRACQHVRSNAIVLSRGTATVGIGGGQPNRVDSLRIALERAGDKAQGAVLASDAFFPFKDCVGLAAKSGIVAIIQPGGSIRDQESVDCANEHGLVMVFTGRRHFRH